MPPPNCQPGAQCQGVTLSTGGFQHVTLFEFTFAVATSATLAAGTYDLWYSSANGLPEVLQTNFVPNVSVPEPASLTLIGSALVGLGWLGRRRRKSA